MAEGAEPPLGASRAEALLRHHPGGGWVKVEDVLEYIKTESDETWTFAEVIHAFKFDKKQRFALRGPAIPHSKFLEIPVWSYQIRANQGHSQEAVNNNPELATTAVSFFDPRPRPLLDDGEKDQTAARNGKPLEMQDEYPKRLSTGLDRRASAMAIVEQGFLVGGGPEVKSGKAHVIITSRTSHRVQVRSQGLS